MTGTKFTNYQILEPLGQGGMGVVYKAWDAALERHVAVKTLAPGVVRDSAYRRFLQEAHAVSKLNHPNIAVLHHIGETNGEPFLVFEFLPGGSLREKLDEAREAGVYLETSEIVRHSLSLARALAHAHRHGVVHRDLKPANILFTADGEAKVIDFGVSKLRGGAELTGDGKTVGTIQYMSPEQAAGDHVDARSDIFALGAVMYEMVAGTPAFDGGNAAATVRQVLEADPPALHELRPLIPERLERVIKHALEKRPEDRFPNMEAMIAALETLAMEGPATEDRLPTVTVELGARRHWRLRLLAIASALAMALAALIWGVRDVRLAIPVERRLAVVPFENAGHDAATQAFADGLLETSTSTLSQIESLRDVLLITPATEVRRQQVRSAADAQRAFGATLAITGDVQHTGDRVVVHVNLVDARRLLQLRSRTIDVRTAELAKVQQKLAEAIAQMLAVEITPEERRKAAQHSSANAAANEAFLRGSGYLQRMDVAGNPARAVVALESAVAMDPTFAQARVTLARAYRKRFADTADARWLELARSSANTALADAPDSAAALAESGEVARVSHDNSGAREQFGRALNLDPANVEAHRGLASCYEAAGDLGAAEQQYRDAIALRPHDWYSRSMLAVFYSRHGRLVEAAAAFRDLVNMAPDNAVEHRNLGAVYIQLGGRDADAETELRRSLTLQPSTSAYTNLGALYLYEHRFADAAQVLERAAARTVPENPLRAYALWSNLGDAYWHAPGLREKATSAYEHAAASVEPLVARDADDAENLSRLALATGKAGRVREARRQMERALALAPKSADVHYRAAVMYERAQMQVSAVREMRAAIQCGYSQRALERDPDLGYLFKTAKTPGR